MPDMFVFDEDNGALLETHLPGALSRRQGKVRDIYEYPDGMLLVATDRVSAFDVVMGSGIPGKGNVLTQISLRWFALTSGIIGNHLLDPDTMPEEVWDHMDVLGGRVMWCKKAEVVPIECVVRGYMAGSGWKAYKEGKRIPGFEDLPDGLVESEQLPHLCFTPTTKEESEHDQPLDMAGVIGRVGPELACQLRDASLVIFGFATGHAAYRGFKLVDTKFEFGIADGELIMVDELLTPDSSRYWDAHSYAVGRPNEAFDKQYLRDWLELEALAGRFDKNGPGIKLPADVVQEVARIYYDCLERLTNNVMPPD